jgi:hypothetical protein
MLPRRFDALRTHSEPKLILVRLSLVATTVDTQTGTSVMLVSRTIDQVRGVLLQLFVTFVLVRVVRDVTWPTRTPCTPAIASFGPDGCTPAAGRSRARPHRARGVIGQTKL